MQKRIDANVMEGWGMGNEIESLNNTTSRVRNIYAASHLPASTSKEGDRGQVIRKHGDKACST